MLLFSLGAIINGFVWGTTGWFIAGPIGAFLAMGFGVASAMTYANRTASPNA